MRETEVLLVCFLNFNSEINNIYYYFQVMLVSRKQTLKKDMEDLENAVKVRIVSISSVPLGILGENIETMVVFDKRARHHLYKLGK